MKNLKMAILGIFLFAGITSCGQTGQTDQKDNVTHDADTMVIKQDQTDSATNSVSTDTTKR